MFDRYSDGYCPQCLLDNEQVAMQVNRGDYWECPTCRLQAAGGGGRFMILRERGEGDFKSYQVLAPEYIVGCYITRQSESDPFASDDYAFKDAEDLRKFVESVK